MADDIPHGQLARARRPVAQGRDRQLRFGLTESPGPELLTPREADVLELLQQRRSNAQIAMELSVGVETVRTHARNIYRKLGVKTRRELATLGAPSSGARSGARIA